MIYDKVKATGDLTIQVIGPDGQIKETHETKNLVVTVGTNYIASRMVGTTSAVMSHMAIGTNSTAAAAANTTLGTEVARVSLTSSTNAANSNQVIYVATFGAGIPNAANTAVVEAGLFNAATGGTMLARTVFPVVNKASADSITITWTVTIGSV